MLLIRHAEPETDLSSGNNPPLSEAGRTQAARLAEALGDSALDRVVCSSMERAAETARPLAEAVGAPLVVEPELREIGLGRLWPWGHEEQRQWSQLVAHWQAGRTDVGPPEGESLDDVAGRVWPIVARHVTDEEAGTLAIVAHGVVNNVILTLLCPDLRADMGMRLEIDHTGIWEVEGSGSTFRVLRRNDTSHLAGGAPEANGPTA